MSAQARLARGGSAVEADAIPASMCRRCGFPGPHGQPQDCIAGLRDHVAVPEFRPAAAHGREIRGLMATAKGRAPEKGE